METITFFELNAIHKAISNDIFKIKSTEDQFWPYAARAVFPMILNYCVLTDKTTVKDVINTINYSDGQIKEVSKIEGNADITKYFNNSKVSDCLRLYILNKLKILLVV